jgi:hypothetical protein
VRPHCPHGQQGTLQGAPFKRLCAIPVEDGYIAATARRHGLTIATGNDPDFKRPGLKVFNPFKELPSGNAAHQWLATA